MSQDNEKVYDYQRVVSEIDKTILALGTGLEELVYLRHQVVSQKYGVDMRELTSILLSSGRISQDEVDIINRVARKKKEQLAYGL